MLAALEGMSAFKISGVGLHPHHSTTVQKSSPSKPYLPPSGGTTGLLGPMQRRTLNSGENLKPTSSDSTKTLERKYIENLQQQVYCLEMELKQLRGAGLDATVRPVESNNSDEMRERVAAYDARAERLREDALRAMISEKRLQEESAKLKDKLARQVDTAASQREELTVEAVSLQRELERAYMVEKTLRAELADANALLASGETLKNQFDAQVRGRWMSEMPS